MVTGNKLVKPSQTCPDARLSCITAYCFGELGEVVQKSFERHLLECDDCWRDVSRLSRSVGVLRSEQSLGESLRAFDMSVITGVPPKLELPFGGHLRHVVTACLLYALLFVVALVLEITYELSNYRPSVWVVSIGVFAWIFLTSILGLAIDWWSTMRQKGSFNYYSIPVFIGATLLLYAALRLYLPNQPITQASFPTYPAHAAYLKDLGYFLPLGILFLILPYHFVLSMQRELSAGRHRLSLALLSGEKWSVVPNGSIFPRVSWLAVLLFGAFAVSLILTSHLLENLLPGSYKSLFVQLVLWRMILYFSLGLECLFWYYRSLNEIKRECLGVVAAESHFSELQNNPSGPRV